MKNLLPLCFLIIYCLTACNVTTSKKIALDTSSIGKLKAYMVGSYDSSIQAAKDSNYYDISLHMYPLWEMDKSSESVYLYVEQAVSSMQDKPYRQRVYEVKALGHNEYVSLVYTLDSPKEYVGLWKDPKRLAAFNKSNIILKDGCGVYLMDMGDHFKGSTKDKECKSTMRGASFATSVVRVAQDTLTSWDQGFDDQGSQVWGAVDGPYEFIRKSK